MSLGLDLSNVVESGSVIPDGSYPVVLDQAEVKPTKTGGQMIKVQFRIIEGPQANRVIFEQYNIKNSNPQAVQIGLGQLLGLMRAFGHPNPNRLESTNELIGLTGIVSTKTATSPGYSDQAKVKAYKPLNTVTAQAAAPAPASVGAGNPF